MTSIDVSYSSSVKPKQLQEFRISKERSTLLSEREVYPDPSGSSQDDIDQDAREVGPEVEETVNARIEDARESMSTPEEVCVWAPVVVDRKYGILFEDVMENSISFKEGRDQKA